MKSEKILEHIMMELAPYHPKNVAVSRFNQDNLNEFSRNENSVKVIFDHLNFKILNISSNVETIFGYTLEELSRDSLFFSLFEEEHETALLTWIKWHIEILTNEGRLSNMKSALCGMKIKHKDGHTRRILMRQIAIEVLENSMPKTSIVTFDVITHLMKADFYWGRSAFGESENRQFHHLISTQQKDISNDIISDREKDVLRLIAQGRESKDIGKALFISLFTVENHRRNMLKRTGVRDTTALVQLCWMCGIL